MMSAPESPRRSGTRWTVATAVLLALFVLWPLSIGPLVWLLRHDIIGPDTYNEVAEIVYAPWGWLYENNEAAQAFFNWYTGLW